MPVVRLQHAAASGATVAAIAPAWPFPTSPGSLLVAVLVYSTQTNDFFASTGWIEACKSAGANALGQRVRILYIHDADSRAGDELFVCGTTAGATVLAVLLEYQGSFTGLSGTATAFNQSAALADTGTTGPFADANALAVAGLGCNVNAATLAAPANGYTTVDSATPAATQTELMAEKIGGLTVAGENTNSVTPATAKVAGAIAVFGTDSADPGWPPSSGLSGNQATNLMGAGVR